MLDQSNFPLPTSFGNGVDRRTFFKVVAQATAAIGLSGSLAAKVVAAVDKGARPSVIWLHFQECTGCTESLLRTSHPGLAKVLFDLISLDYHETLMAAAGHQAEQALESAIQKNAGKYVLVVEGALPTKDSPNDTGFKDDGKYSWVKSPRFEGHPMQVGPLSQVLIGYAQGHKLTHKWAGEALNRVPPSPRNRLLL